MVLCIYEASLPFIASKNYKGGDLRGCASHRNLLPSWYNALLIPGHITFASEKGLYGVWPGISQQPVYWGEVITC